MKLSKTSWLFIIVGIFIILLVGLGVVRSQQVRQLGQLNEELALAQSRLEAIQLDRFSHRQEELEQQLSQSTPQPETAKATLSQPIGSIAISDTLFNIAEANSVNITELSSSGLASEELAGVTCSVLPVWARIEGDLTNLASFITQLNDELETSVIKSVDITVPETTGEQQPIANIQMAVYTYQGD